MFSTISKISSWLSNFFGGKKPSNANGAYDARAIANWFIERAARDKKRVGKKDEFFSVLSLVKMTYIAHGWNLSLNGEPLYFNRTEAWRYGPVIPEVYEAFRKQGDEIKRPVWLMSRRQISKQHEVLLEQIYDLYGKFEPWDLSNLTHIKGGPWDIAFRAGGRFAPIPDILIRLHYDEKRIENVKAKNG